MEKSTSAVSGHHISVTGRFGSAALHPVGVDIAFCNFIEQIITFAVAADFTGGEKRQRRVGSCEVEKHVGRTAAGSEYFVFDIAEISFAGPAVDCFDFIQNPVAGTDNSFFHNERTFRLSVEHDLTAGDRDSLTGFILLFHRIDDSFGNVGGEAAAADGNEGFIMLADIGDSFCTGDFAGFEILDEQAANGVAPQRTVEEVSGADGVDFDLIGNQFQREALDETDTAEFTSCISTVVFGTGKSDL